MFVKDRSNRTYDQITAIIVPIAEFVDGVGGGRSGSGEGSLDREHRVCVIGAEQNVLAGDLLIVTAP
jgi:hypothetical protein